MTDSTHKSLNALMRHIRAAGIDIGGSRHKRELATVGYFHGYKGYRFGGTPSNRIPYARFDELAAVIEFDHGLKALLYPLLMRLEMAMKNRALIEVLEQADSSLLSDVYARLMPGDRNKKRQGKLELIHANSEVLLSRYKRGDRIITHYYDSPGESVPVWALFEVITLGHFANFLEQLAPDVLVSIAGSWGLRKNDAELVPHLIYGVTDLRNAVAHNSVVFDTRFATGKVRQRIADLVGRELALDPSVRIAFDTITDYLVLVLFLSVRLGLKKRDAYRVVRDYIALTDTLRGAVPVRVFDMIVHTDNRAKVKRLESWVRAL